MDNLVRQHIIAELEASLVDETLRATKITELESQGLRLVSRTQSDSYDGAGRSSWAVTDWRTGELLAAGTGTADEFAAGWAELAAAGRWFDFDRLHYEMPLTLAATPGLPPTLALMLEEWIALTGTPDEEIAEFIGWDPAKVRLYRSGPRAI